MDAAGIQRELDHGAKFVMFQYCISIVIMTLKRPSDIYFVRSGESGLRYGWKYALISLAFGWWGIPWGPIYTIGTFFTSVSGGKDITQEVLSSITVEQTEAAA